MGVKKEEPFSLAQDYVRFMANLSLFVGQSGSLALEVLGPSARVHIKQAMHVLGVAIMELLRGGIRTRWLSPARAAALKRIRGHVTEHVQRGTIVLLGFEHHIVHEDLKETIQTKIREKTSSSFPLSLVNLERDQTLRITGGRENAILVVVFAFEKEQLKKIVHELNRKDNPSRVVLFGDTKPMIFENHLKGMGGNSLYMNTDETDKTNLEDFIPSAFLQAFL
jgi:hypothetical protein